MNKICTTIEQSKKLIELGIDVNTADMFWADGERPAVWNNKDTSLDEMDIPAWSLAALFKLLPKCIEGAEPSLIKTFRDDYRIVYDIHGDENITSEDYTNPIDACYEMIIRLKENDLL